VIPAPLGFFEVVRELVCPNPSLFGQPGLGKTPEGFDAVDVPFASGKFVLVVMHAMITHKHSDKIESYRLLAEAFSL
jgi:hypothetical protein